MATQSTQTTGILFPFRRDEKNDFASATGPDVIRANVIQILTTKCAGRKNKGELPWRTNFGCLVYVLRHSNDREVNRAMARVYVVDALTLWEPRVQVTDVGLDVYKTAWYLRVYYDIVEGGAVILSGESADVPLLLAA